MKKIGMFGYGTVGRGFFGLMQRNGDVVSKNAGVELEVCRVFARREFPGDPVEPFLTHRVEDLWEDDSIDIIVEVLAGVEPAYQWTKQALLAGKSVVTSNKAVVAAHGAELISIARQKGVSYLFEGSVGGAIPVLRTVTHGLISDHISEIWGILNGTTNYILTEMKDKGAAFDDVLKEAQRRGYAEADPTADVEGHDACRKLAILSSLAFGAMANYEEIHTEGISAITKEDIAYGKAMGCDIKLLASAKRTETGISALVAPSFVPKNHPLAAVQGVMNAVFIKGDMSGETMYYGPGAGEFPTASAVASDIVAAATGVETYPGLAVEGHLVVLPRQKRKTKVFYRILVSDVEEAKKTCNEVLDVVQFVALEGVAGEIGVISGAQEEGVLGEKTNLLSKGKGIRQILSRIRMEE